MRVLALMAGLAVLAAAPPAKADKLNVVFIISDDLSAETLSCYGSPQSRTPNIDALAERGVRFTRVYCQYPVCGPSRAALMSGMYAQAIGVTSNGAATRFTKNLGDRPSMAQHFRNHGWHTARISKIYHMRVPGDITAGVDGPDHEASWTERYNCRGPEWMSEGAHEHLSNEKLRKEPDKHYGLGFGTAFYVVKGSTDGSEQPDIQAANKAVELIGKHRDTPFFLAVGLVRPHVPLVAPKAWFDRYPPETLKPAERVKGDWDDIPKAGISKNSRSSGITPERELRVLSAYYAAVAFMDAQVGRIVKAVDDAGLRDRTIIVFTADHGYHLGEHDFWQKMSLHEESTRIPLILSIPGRKPAVTDALGQQIDIYPTLAELCGLDVPKHVQGKSLKPAVEDPSREVHREVYCLKSKGHLLRTERWAYLSWGRGGEELYDMENDPKQYTNLAGETAHAATLEDLRARLKAKLEAIGGK